MKTLKTVNAKNEIMKDLKTVNAKNEIMKDLKTVNAKIGEVIEKSANQLKIEGRILELETKKANEGLTPHEARILQNNKYKLDSRGASRLYKDAQSLPKADLENMLGNSPFPTFKEFADLLPQKPLFSMWDALGVLTKLNKAETLKAKIAKQNAKTKAK